MSNQTELPDLERLLSRAEQIAKWLSTATMRQSAADVQALIALARRAQPEGEAPQAVAQVQLNGDSWMDVAANELPTWERKRFKARTLYTAPAAQQAAAPGASAQPHKIHELLRIYDEKNGDWCAVARAVESRYVDAASAPGTPEAPKGGA